MIYKLKKDNYKNFNVYKDNILESRSYFIPFNDEKELLECDIRTERYSSSMVAVLSGEWQFKYYDNCQNIPDEFDAGNLLDMRNHIILIQDIRLSASLRSFRKIARREFT